ncbi:MAG: HipA family kinase, partial [Pirellulales bacterium]
MIWHPSCITQFVEARKSSTQVVIVETDAGRGFLKAMGNPEGEHALACDWVGTQLARWFGLPTLEQAIVDVDEFVDIRLFNGDLAKLGPALATRAVPGDSWSGEPRQLTKLRNPDDISRLVVFDTWILNRDRHSQDRQNRDNVFLSVESGELELLAIDHTHCFGTSGGELSERVAQIENCKDRGVYGRFPEFEKFLNRGVVTQCVEQLGRIDETTVRQIIDEIPDEWQVADRAKSA